MAKKKEIVIDDRELVPTTIGKVENKVTGLIYLTFVFILLVSFVLYLPEITEYITDKYFTTEPNNQLIKNESEQEYNEGLVLETDKAIIKDILFENNVLTFKLVNKTSDELSLYDEKVYLQGFSDQDKLLFIINFEDKDLEPGETYEYEMDLVVSSIDHFEFGLVLESEYPDVELTTNEDKNSVLVCSKENKTLTYYFDNKKLYNVDLKVNILTDEDEVVYSKLYQDYSNINGVLSTYENGYTKVFEAKYDISKYDEYLYNEDFLFTDEEEAKNVNFINISKGYDCY